MPQQGLQQLRPHKREKGIGTLATKKYPKPRALLALAKVEKELLDRKCHHASRRLTHAHKELTTHTLCMETPWGQIYLCLCSVAAGTKKSGVSILCGKKPFLCEPP